MPPDPATLPVFVVTGLGRCGTTLVMRMLEAGGCPVFYENDLLCELSEDNPTDALDAAEFEPLRGKAVKLLGLDVKRLPPELPWVLLDCRRARIHEQARSFRKFAAHARPDGVLRSHTATLKALTQRLRAHAAAIRALPRAVVVPVVFEDLLTDPVAVASQIAAAVLEHAGHTLDVAAMAALVDTARSSDSEPDALFLVREQRMAEVRP